MIASPLARLERMMASPLARLEQMTPVMMALWRKLLPPHRLCTVAKTPVLVALGVYLAGGSSRHGMIAATMALASLLWMALYAVNEASDVALEQGSPVPSGAYLAIGGAVGVICLVASLLSGQLAALFALMACGQMFYSVPPFRVKRWWWAVVFVSGVYNPLLRLECGSLWGPSGVAPLALLVIVLIHAGSALRTRVLLRERDERLGYRPAPRMAEGWGAFLTGAGAAGSCWLWVKGTLPPLFGLCVAIGIVFAAYAWKSRDIKRLRRGWIGFVVVALFAVVILLRGH